MGDCCVISYDFGEKITIHFRGPRHQCHKWVNDKAKIGRPTHFYDVMSEGKAFKKIEEARKNREAMWKSYGQACERRAGGSS